MKTLAIVALVMAASMSCAAVSHAAQRPPMPSETIDPKCVWNWKTGGGVGIWAQDCELATGKWEVLWNEAEAGFELKLNGEKTATVLQIFRKNRDAPASAILPELRKRGFIPDSDECVLTPATIRPAVRTIQFYEIRPIGSRLKALQAAPKDEIPDPPCPDYGVSTHGIRYFQHDLRKPDVVLYIDEGQDGTFYDPKTITFE